MIKCKVASVAECGRVICCATCDLKLTCEEVCPTVKEDGITDPLQECDEAEELGEVVDLNKQVPNVIKAISDICVQKKKLEEQEKAMKESLQKAMEQYGVKKFENEVISVTYVASTVRNSIDSAKLKKELPDIAKKYNKKSKVSASVRITVK